MKRCPKCNSVSPDEDIYCDLDGTLLIKDSQLDTSSKVESWKITAIGVIAGLAIGVAIFVIYFGLTREKPLETAQVSSNNSIAQQPPPLLRPEPVPSSSPSPSPSSTPSPSPAPSPSPSASPSPSPQPSESSKLSSSPVSTSVATASKGTMVTIRLTNGSSIEAEEAWEGSEGIWYRRNGVVSLLDRKQVKTIERPKPPPTPSPSN